MELLILLPLPKSVIFLLVPSQLIASLFIQFKNLGIILDSTLSLIAPYPISSKSCNHYIQKISYHFHLYNCRPSDHHRLPRPPNNLWIGLSSATLTSRPHAYLPHSSHCDPVKIRLSPAFPIFLMPHISFQNKIKVFTVTNRSRNHLTPDNASVTIGTTKDKHITATLTPFHINHLDYTNTSLNLFWYAYSLQTNNS